MIYEAYWDAGYGCTGRIRLSGVWASEAAALRHARFIIGGRVIGVRVIK